MIDIYAETRSVVGDLRAVGQDSFADMLEAAVEDGFTATEILMAVHCVIENAPEFTDHPALARRAGHLAAQISAALR